ncbi:MAG: hypothetical protein EOP24_25930 [Hyphomicrobiales bacterium]|nr:MAG: hypothetical protein EOP24_25930 [Hyphomicrobiales bacterium]
MPPHPLPPPWAVPRPPFAPPPPARLPPPEPFAMRKLPNAPSLPNGGDPVGRHTEGCSHRRRQGSARFSSPCETAPPTGFTAERCMKHAGPRGPAFLPKLAKDGLPTRIRPRSTRPPLLCARF